MAATTVLANALAEIMGAVDTIMGDSTAALGLTIPLAGLAIGVAKRIFRSRRG